MKNQAHPIVVVKRRRHKPHGGGAHGSWKIAYADFMTAMMAFFLVMWLISISSPKELIQIAEYFRTPLATAVTGGNRIANSESPIPGGGTRAKQCRSLAAASGCDGERGESANPTLGRVV